MKNKGDILISSLTKYEAIQELNRLAGEIQVHDLAYHRDDNPIISDSEYDGLRRRANEIFGRFPNLKPDKLGIDKVGAELAPGFKKITHAKPMLSLSNVFNAEDLSEFLAGIRRFLKELERDPSLPLEVVSEPKIDGVSISLSYDKGILRHAVTRGDGATGEDVTDNVRTIKSVPRRLSGEVPDVIEIRGEIYLTKSDFQILNNNQLDKGERVFANPRNAAAGSLRQLDSRVTGARPLKLFAYTWGMTSKDIVATQMEFLERLEAWGFSVNPLTRLCGTMDDMLDTYNEASNYRAELDYDIDGIVYKVNRVDWQERLGFVSRSPRWAVAHKFAAEQATTQLLDIIIQVGRTGSLTPVAKLIPVNIGGVMVSNASLHNEDEIQRKDIRIGDVVIVQRAGDVIPQVVSALADKRTQALDPFVMPKNCPACGSPATKPIGEAVRRCSGDLVCSAQSIERFKHFVSRNAFNIEGIGDKNIISFVKFGLITNLADIFDLREHKEKLLTHDGWGNQSFENLVNNIEKQRTISLQRFIFALGIRHVGQAMAGLLAKHYITYDAWRNGMVRASDSGSDSYENLMSIDGVGESIAQGLANFFKHSKNIQILEALSERIKIKPHELKKTVTSKISGKVVVFTGTLESVSRGEAKAQAEALGAKVSSSVSKNTDLLIVGSNPGSKAKKAKELGVRILSEGEWLENLNQ